MDDVENHDYWRNGIDVHGYALQDAVPWWSVNGRDREHGQTIILHKTPAAIHVIDKRRQTADEAAIVALTVHDMLVDKTYEQCHD